MSAIKRLHPQYMVDPDGHKMAVVLPFNEYEELLEDLSDLAVVAERREEKTISHDQLLKDLKADGTI